MRNTLPIQRSIREVFISIAGINVYLASNVSNSLAMVPVEPVVHVGKVLVIWVNKIHPLGVRVLLYFSVDLKSADGEGKEGGGRMEF